MGRDRDWTTPEIAGLVAWRIVRNGQLRFTSPDLMAEFNQDSRTIRFMFEVLEDVTTVNRTKNEAGMIGFNVFDLVGDLTPANGKPLTPVQGAFLFSYVLARDFWATESELARLARWERSRVYQMVKWKLRALPIWRRPGNEDALWVDINFQDHNPKGEDLPPGSCTQCGWPPGDIDNLVNDTGLCSWCRAENQGQGFIRY